MKTIIAVIIIALSIGTTLASEQPKILACSSGFEYQSALKLISNKGQYDRYRVIGTNEFVSCLKK